MSASRVLWDALEAGVQLRADGDQIGFRLTRGSLDPELKRDLKARKAELVALLGQGRRYALPSFAQQRLWFLDRLAPGNAFYNLPSAFRLRGILHRGAIAEALAEIVRRHESLRTTFTLVEEQPVQVIRPAPADAGVPWVDLAALPPALGRSEAQRLIDREAARAFDLGSGPLLRSVLLCLGPEEHVLFVNMHHIVTDVWSLGVFFGELAELYGIFREGRPSSLPELPLQYADYAVWARQELRGEKLEARLRAWRKILGEDPTPLQLPSDRPRLPFQRFRGGTLPLGLPASLAGPLRALSREQGATPAMTLLAGWLTLLYRATGKTRIPVGSPIAGRTRREVEGLIGFFVNTLTMVGDFSPGPGHRAPTFRELLGRVREMALEVYSHQDLPFEKLVDELGLPRDLSRNPLFQVLFVLQNAPAQAPELPGLTLEPMDFAVHSTHFDLEVHLWDHPQELVGGCSYDRDLFDSTTVQRMLGHFRTLLAGIVADPDARVTELPWLTAAEAHQLLEWNDTARPRPRPGPGVRSLTELLEAQAARTPETVAVVGGEEHLSYRELHRRANRLARSLRRRGVGPEVPVAVLAQRTPELAVAFLGVLKSGGIYLPLDPTYPEERRRFLRDDAGAAVLLRPEEDGSQIAGESAEPLADPTDADRVCCLIYTSGSTGRPKGVALPQRTLLNLTEWHLGTHRLPARTLQFAALGFDMSLYEMCIAWASGSTLILIPDPLRLDPGALARFLARTRVEKAALPVALLRELSQISPLPMPGLREVISAGEQLQLTPALAAAFERWRDCRLRNQYGPSETHVVTDYACRGEARSWPAHAPIGTPIANTRVWSLDPRGRPVPIGVPGELYVGGSNVARGYWRRPGLTAERFVPNPLPRATAGDRLYRTGDLGRYLPDGNLEFLGRIDDQVKIRGFRVEPGEIESLLARHPAVQAAAVVLTAGAAAVGPELVAFYVPRDQAGVSPEQLRASLGETLPDSMIPAAFVALDALPLSPNKKLDRAALRLRAQEDRQAAERSSRIAPRTGIEEILAEIWKEILGLEAVGVDDDFFALGGHSLLVTRVLSRVRELFGVELAVRTFFDASTVGALARRIEAALGAGKGLEVPPLRPLPRDRGRLNVPLSFAQQRLWFLDRLEGGSAFYNLAAALRLSGPLEVEALRRTFEEIVRRHAVLRTRFTTREGRAVQEIAASGSWALPVVDWRGPAGELRRLLRREAGRSFDLERGPLLRTILFRSHPGEHVLFLVIHHIVSDGWSLGILVRELGTIYAAFCARRPSPLPELPIQYADFAVWQRQWLDGRVLEAQLAYWRAQLAGAPPLELPSDRPRPRVRSYRGSARVFHLAAELGEPLRRLSREQGVTLFMTLVAAFKILLHRYSDQDDLCVGTPIANRGAREIEDLVGCFVNTLVLRTQLSGELAYPEFLRRVRAAALAAYTHQDLPFERLVDELSLDRDLARTPLFQVMFVLQNAPMGELRLPGLGIESLAVEMATSKFDLTLSMSDGSDDPGFLEYDSDLFDATTIARLLHHFEVLLRGIAAAPERRIGEFELRTRAESHQLLREWNDSRVSTGPAAWIHERFEAQAERTPEAVAVVGEAQQLTYAELLARSHRLAVALRRLGVGPEVRVGICVERSPEMVVGFLGILKAGGAYVPLDPSDPRERLAFILADAGCPLLLTQGRLRDRLPEHHGRQVLLDQDGAEIAAHPVPETGGPRLSGTNLAYVIYTSGSTGRPKGAMNTHAGIVNRLLWMQAEYPLAAGDRVLHKTPISFDVSVWEYFWPLTVGARLVLARPEGHRDSTYLARLIACERIAVLHFVPSMLEAVLRDPEFSRGESTPLRRVIASGEALSTELARRFSERLGALGVKLHNLYGPTEAAVDVTHGACDREPEERGSGVPIGHPVANTRIHLLDRRLRPVPVGIPGQLHIAGVQLARGYLGRPGLTAERFLPDPFGTAPGERTYQTGDLARYLGDGNLEFLGRLDHQVKLRGYRIELGEIEAVLLAHSAVQACVVMHQEQANSARLVAFVVPVRGLETKASELRRQLRVELPEYMVPAVFVAVEALPLLASGKVDRAALRRQFPEASEELQTPGGYVAPQTPLEKLLAEIWCEVLGHPRMGIHDPFFKVGGDSILALHIVIRAHQSGLDMAPMQIFEHQTIAQLARVVKPLPASAAVPEAPATGEAELTPIQQWFFEQELADPHHWNQAVVLRVARQVKPDVLRRALSAVVEVHDALRLRFTRDARGWRQYHGSSSEPLPWSFSDLSGLPAQAARRAFEQAAGRCQANLSLAQGPLLRCVVFELGSDDRLLLWVIHHLAVDGVSWRILLEDLRTAVEHLLAGRAIELPARTVAFKSWAAGISHWVAGGGARDELPYWLALGDMPRPALPVDGAGGENTVASLREIVVELGQEQTRKLLREVGSAYRTRIQEVLVTALVGTLARWIGSSGVWVMLEGHGREELAGQDVSRTVGWFTSLYPGYLELDAARPGRGEALKSIKEQLRAIPRAGVGFGALRYLSPEAEVREKLAELPVPEVVFNYLGQVDTVLPDPESAAALLAFAEGPVGALRSPRNRRSQLLEINAVIAQGRLRISWFSSAAFHRRETVEELGRRYLDELRELIAHCLEPGAGGYTPSDFPLAGLDQAILDRMLPPREVEALYPLSPMQEGMLFHALWAPDSSVYFEQMAFTVRAGADEVDEDAFEQAWQHVVAHQPVLRTSFLWEGLNHPLQCVHRQVPFPFERQDWRSLDEAAAAARLEAFLAADRGQGFDLARPRLLRVSSLALPGRRHAFVLSHHHILFDGWSYQVVLGDVVRAYQQLRAGHRPRPHDSAPPFERYVAWLEGQDLSGAEVLWRRSLRGFAGPTALPGSKPASPDPGRSQEPRKVEFRLPVASTARLRRLVEEHHLTLNTVMQGAWALLLSRYCGQPDVLFGITVSGRSPEVAGVERMVGLFINTLPLRVKVEDGEPLVAWLAKLQAQQLKLRAYETVPLVKIRGWSEVPAGAPLFESILVFENYPPDSALQESSFPMVVEQIRTFERTNYPCILVVGAQQQLVLRLDYDPERCEPTAMSRVASELGVLLEAMIAAPQGRLGELPMLSAGESRPILHPGRIPEGNEFVLPRNRLELELVPIWEELLERHPIGVRDNFFDLGGHSLLAMRLMAWIRSRLGLELPLARILEASTIEALALVLGKRPRNQPVSPLVSFRPPGKSEENHQPPFFCVHPAGGAVVCYRQLAELLGPTQPFYGFQAPALEPGTHSPPPDSVEEMARGYLELLRQVRPQGPYLLGGWSFGGLVAFEMARQLRAADREVPVLVLIDTPAPEGGGDQPPVDELGLLHLLAEQEGVEVAEEELRSLGKDKALARVAELAAQARIMPPGSEQYIARIVAVHQAALTATARYLPEPYRGRLSLLRARDADAARHRGTDYGWRAYVAPGDGDTGDCVEVYELPGDHYTIVMEHADEVAKVLSQVLRIP